MHNFKWGEVVEYHFDHGKDKPNLIVGKCYKVLPMITSTFANILFVKDEDGEIIDVPSWRFAHVKES